MRHDISAFLQQPPGSIGELEALLCALDALPEADCAAHLPVVREVVAAWIAQAPAAALADALRCADATLAVWRPEDLHVSEVEALFPRLLPRLQGTPAPFEPLRFGWTLRRLFLELGSAWVAEDLALPPALLTWLRLAEDRLWCARPDDPYARCLYGHSALLANTQSQCETFRWDRQRDLAEEPPDQTRPEGELDAISAALREITPRAVSERGTGAWLEIGDWSDKHTTALCCSRAGDWGVVLDYHDGHPWLNGGGWGDPEAESLLVYLARLADW